MKNRYWSIRLSLFLSLILSMGHLYPIGAAEKENTIAEVAEEIEKEELRLQDMVPEKDYLPNRGFVVTESEEEAERAALLYGGRLVRYQAKVGVLEFGSGIEEALAEGKLQNADIALHPDILFSNMTYSAQSLEEYNDPYIGEQWFHSCIDDVSAWNVTKGKGAIIAVLDSGAEVRHGDLQDRIVGKIDAGSGADDVSDVISHGTHVAGILSATLNNGMGGSGVAPEASLYIVKVAEDNGDVPLSNIITGINLAIEKKVHVINMSFGATGRGMADKALEDALDRAHSEGITLVAAAGNGMDDGGNGVSTPTYPAAYDHVIAVAASTKDGKLAPYSNYGSWVDLVAPGGSGDSNKSDAYILSTSNGVDGDYAGQAGTSQAAPMVAGTAALVYASDPALLKLRSAEAADRVTGQILSNTDGQAYSYDGNTIIGCVNAAAAISGYRFRENSGYLTNSGNHAIGRGKGIKLQIAYVNGEPVKAAKKAKNVAWSVSNNSYFSIKNGKLKCLKSAPLGSHTTVFANFGGSIVSADFVAVEPAKKLGYLEGGQPYKLKTKGEASIKSGEWVSVSQIDALLKKEVRAFSEKPKKTLSGSSVDAAQVGYAIKISKPKKSTVSGADAHGNPLMFKALASGSYTITYTLSDGSGKKFKIKCTAE
ncbi:MAG: S8 family serine peptidase [Lachnospiraceae bacterium]|nr:S8 family serine peptidase [Lachnospiraceae bacterium]